ncbi:MAG: ISAs1 family transposase [Oscillatoria sp. SIO1A7]|nr:ISAs1 family transposase [Oscillatoria sp. SIO1A7]
MVDTRVERTKEHKLIDIIAISIMAVISGAEGWVAIETYGKAKQSWLKEFLSLPNGIPSHDTFGRVWSIISTEEFNKCFLNWLDTLVKKCGIDVVSIDGKTLKQSYDRSNSQSALHIVSAWSSSHKLVLGQKKIDDKSNEITAIPALIEMLDIQDSIITIDAMGCQKKIASLLINKKADYVLGLKGNQGNIHKEVKAFFNKAKKQKFIGEVADFYRTTEAGHGRIETRKIWAVSISELPGKYREKWAGLKTIVMVVSERRLWNKTTTGVRYYLSSLECNARLLAEVIRSHWGIENELHWTLDVTFKEDASRIRKDRATENFALLRRIALNLLNREDSYKASKKMKRYRAAMDNDYLLSILAAGCVS